MSEKDLRLTVSQKSENNNVEFLPDSEVKSTKKKWRWQMGHDDSPPQIYNRTLFLSVFVFGILGAARGYDEGCSKY